MRSYDFVADWTADGRPLRLLTVIDDYTRRCLAISVQRRLRLDDVLHTLTELFVRHGPLEHIRWDNVPEFTARAVRERLHHLGAKALFIETGSSWENSYNETLKGNLREELLDSARFSAPGPRPRS